MMPVQLMQDADPIAATAAEVGGPASTDLAAGQSVGKYRLDRVIGTGGMGVVWQAFDPDLERAVALKVLHSPHGEPTLRTRLLREARAMARLKHPNVVTVYEVGTDRGRDYIAMELVEGENLDVWLATKPPRPEIVDALFGAARGLAAAHDAGLVHRDFKPHNVLRDRTGHVFVTDFGLARGTVDDGPELVPLAAGSIELASRRPHDSVLDTPLTQTGALIGTPAYMAPEQFTGGVPDHRTDQFAFCVTAWQALTGVRPFGGNSLAELEEAIGGGVTAQPRELPPHLRAVLVRGLSVDPAARWPDLRALVRALEDAVRPRPRWLRWVVVGALLVVAGSLAMFFATRPASRPSADEECAAPDKAFDKVWSVKRRAEILAAREGDTSLIGPFSLLDQMKSQWTSSFRAACAAAPQTLETRERVNCLLGVRDRLADTTARMTDPTSKIDEEHVFPLGEMMLCDRNLDFGPSLELLKKMPKPRRFKLEAIETPDELDATETPEPPPKVPPAPPVPPVPPKSH